MHQTSVSSRQNSSLGRICDRCDPARWLARTLAVPHGVGGQATRRGLALVGRAYLLAAASLVPPAYLRSTQPDRPNCRACACTGQSSWSNAAALQSTARQGDPALIRLEQITHQLQERRVAVDEHNPRTCHRARLRVRAVVAAAARR